MKISKLTSELQAERERLAKKAEQAKRTLDNIESYTFSEVQFAHAEICQAEKLLKEFNEVQEA